MSRPDTAQKETAIAISKSQRSTLHDHRPASDAEWPGVAAEIMRLREQSPAAFLYIMNASIDPNTHHRIRVLIRDYPERWAEYVAVLEAELPKFPPRYLDAGGPSDTERRLDNLRREICRPLPPIPEIPSRP